MLEKLAAAHKAGKLRFFGEHAHLASADAFAAFLAPLRKTKWFVYSKRPFSGPKTVLAYLSRYTHRVAISNRRLIAADKTERHLQIQGLPDRGAWPLQDHDARDGRVHPPLPDRMCCPRASTASAITGFWPAASARTIWPRCASCSPWRAASNAGKCRQGRCACGRCAGLSSAPVAAAACSSSRPSRGAAGGADRRSARSGSIRHERRQSPACINALLVPPFIGWRHWRLAISATEERFKLLRAGLRRRHRHKNTAAAPSSLRACVLRSSWPPKQHPRLLCKSP